jgi:hypothetical protein
MLYVNKTGHLCSAAVDRRNGGLTRSRDSAERSPRSEIRIWGSTATSVCAGRRSMHRRSSPARFESASGRMSSDPPHTTKQSLQFFKRHSRTTMSPDQQRKLVAQDFFGSNSGHTSLVNGAGDGSDVFSSGPCPGKHQPFCTIIGHFS